MGILHLMRDLLPFARKVVLGKSGKAADGAPSIQRIIVDAPSVVHFVYDRLVRYRAQEAGAGAIRLPTYDEIGGAYLFLLAEIRSHGVDIDAIYFDGAVPASKEESRLQRLNKRRKRLEEFRRLRVNRDTVPPPASSKLPIDYSRALWPAGTAPPVQVILPHPPFMVPSVIETLLQSPWSERVHVVPEEADVACARSARLTGATILSDDSDLSAYNLNRGSVAVLQTLEKTQQRQSGGASELTVSCICPEIVAQSLRIPSVQRLAFQRSLDSRGTTPVIAERARTSVIKTKQNEFKTFKTTYHISECWWPDADLNLLDPRIAEHVVHINEHEPSSTPRLYLPLLHEDPDRDYSWSYGQGLRQLAYSLYASLADPAPLKGTVIEYARKGARVGTTDVTHLDSNELDAAVCAALEDLRHVGAWLPIQWWAYALRRVVKQKLDAGKSISLGDVQALLLGQADNPLECSWSTLHLHANIQAVLYSTRILRQLLQYAQKGERTSELGQLLTVDELEMALADLPSIAELFLNVEELRLLALARPEETKAMIERVKLFLEEHDAGFTNPYLPAIRHVEGPHEGFDTPRKRPKWTKKQKSPPVAPRGNIFDLLAQRSSGSESD